MSKKDKTKKDLELEIEDLTEQLQKVSAGYQGLVANVNGLQALVMKYEETINILTGRLIEARRQVN